MVLDFDLEVQGNKKSIRIKDFGNSTKSSKKKKNTFIEPYDNPGSLTPEARIDAIVPHFSPQKDESNQNNTCSFFQRFR